MTWEKLLANLKNWPTTIGGIVLILSTVSIFVTAMTDGDPETVPNLEAVVGSIITGLIIIGLLPARKIEPTEDADKPSPNLKSEEKPFSRLHRYEQRGD